MRYIRTYETYETKSTLLIVDVQKSFHDFFTDNYLNELCKYCKKFQNVYQIWDNHKQGKDVDKDYLYDENPDIPINDDLYKFPNQVDIIEKRYNYDVDADFYKKILDPNIYKEVSDKEDNKQLKRGDVFKTKEGTIITYIGNNHVWFHCPIKLYELLQQLKDQEVIICGGADNECVTDIITTAKSLGVNVKINKNFIYSATNCPI